MSRPEQSNESQAGLQGSNIDAAASLYKSKILGIPESAFYVPNFISEAEEALITSKVRLIPKPLSNILFSPLLLLWLTQV
jgi:hypothetical protein